jgi:hypothetical protein
MYHLLDKSLFVGLVLIVLLFSCSESPKPSTAITVLNTDLTATRKPNMSVKYVSFDRTKFTAVPTEGENQTWDFSNNKAATTVTPSTTNYLAPQPNTSFKTATFSQKYTSNVLGLNLSLTDHYEISATGYYNLGSQIQPTSVPLGNGVVLTTVGNESPQTPKLLVWKLPMVYKDSYSSESVLRESFRLTAPPFGLNNAPTDRVGTVKLQVQVAGWGKLILPGDASVTTNDVLLVKTTATFTYNYLLNGATAPAALTGALGLTQGETTTRVFYEFFAKNSGNIAEVSFEADATGKPKFPSYQAYYLSK